MPTNICTLSLGSSIVLKSGKVLQRRNLHKYLCTMEFGTIYLLIVLQ